MKTLYLFRHAKSSWSFDLADHDRPLGKRGRKDVRKMSYFLNEHMTPPEIIISSTASRAFYTALHICDGFRIDEGIIRLTNKLYHAEPAEILDVIRKAPPCESLAIFGHNPGFTLVANQLANLRIDNIPTGAVLGITFEIEDWSQVDFNTGKQLFFFFPKGI